jgi:hypothetical protein
VTLAVTVENTLLAGTPIVNADYDVRADQVLTPVVGPPVETLVPWRFFLQFILATYHFQG